MGLVIRNAILLIEYINEARQEGMSIDEACYYAVERRYRPVILSSVTTVIGLVPLALSGSDLFMPLSVALMSGLLVSTLFTLLVVPVVYSILVRERKSLPVHANVNSNNCEKVQNRDQAPPVFRGVALLRRNHYCARSTSVLRDRI